MYACFHSVGLHQLPPTRMVERVARAGYAGVELNAETLPYAKPHVTPETSTQDRAAIVRTCKANAIRIPALGAKINMVDANAAAREHAIGFVKGCIDLAADMNVPFVHILSGKPASTIDRETAWHWFAEAVQALTDYAQSRRVEIGIEAIVGQLFRSVDDFHRLYADLPGVPFWVNFDPSHFIVQDEEPRRVPDELGDKIRHVHLKDGKGKYPDFSFPPLGQGNIDFADLVQRLSGVGYDGALSVEYEAQAFGYELSEEQIVEGEKAFVDRLL